MPSVKISEYEIKNYISEIDSTKYEIFREYEKKNNVFQGTNNFFIKNILTDEINEKYIKICGNKNERYIEKNNNKYLLYFDINYDEKKINQESETSNEIRESRSSNDKDSTMTKSHNGPTEDSEEKI